MFNAGFENQKFPKRGPKCDFAVSENAPALCLMLDLETIVFGDLPNWVSCAKSSITCADFGPKGAPAMTFCGVGERPALCLMLDLKINDSKKGSNMAFCSVGERPALCLMLGLAQMVFGDVPNWVSENDPPCVSHWISKTNKTWKMRSLRNPALFIGRNLEVPANKRWRNLWKCEILPKLVSFAESGKN